MKGTYIFAGLTAMIVLGLAMAAFTLSYDAQRDLAQTVGGIEPGLSWLFPLTVDGFIVAATLTVLANGLAGERSRFAWSLVGAFTLASIGFNVIHSGAGIVGQMIAAVAPVALFLSLELLMGHLRAIVTRREAQIATRDLRQRVKDLSSDLKRISDDLTNARSKNRRLAELIREKEQTLQYLDQMIAERQDMIDNLPNVDLLTDVDDPNDLDVDQRRSLVAEMVNPELTVTQNAQRLAEQLNVSVSTIKRDMRAISNGHK